MNEVGFNREQSKLHLRYCVLKEHAASKIEMRQMLVKTKGPNIKARYMMFIGRLEFKAYELKVELKRWKRRLALRQAALNRGDVPDLAAIEATLAREFEEYMAEVTRRAEEIEANKRLFAAERIPGKMATAVRAAYLDAVKRLHPDLNPDLPDAAKELWNEIQAAYAARDWDAVLHLVALVDSVVSGEADFASAPDAIAALKEACARLEEKSRELDEEIRRIQNSAPFTYEALLNDPAKVAARQDELKAEIVELKVRIGKCEEVWKNG